MVTVQDRVVFMGLGYENVSRCVSDFAQNEEILLTLLENDTDGLPKVFTINGVIAPFSKTIRRDRAMDTWVKIGYGRPAMSLDIISYEDKK